MKKIALFLMLCLLLFPLTGCQSSAPKEDPNPPEESTLAQLPDTQELTFMVEGLEQTQTLTKAQHDDYYAMYYDADQFLYAAGEEIDGGFTDKLLSVDDDETEMTPTMIKICYSPSCTPEAWIAQIEPFSEFSPQSSPISSCLPSWEATEDTVVLGDDTRTFQVWTCNSQSTQMMNACYTTAFREGCLAILLSCPPEYEEGLGARMQTMAKTLVLAAE